MKTLKRVVAWPFKTRRRTAVSTIGLTLAVVFLLLRACGGGERTIELTLTEDEPVATATVVVSRLSGASLTCHATFVACADPTWDECIKIVPESYCNEGVARAMSYVLGDLAASQLEPLDCGKGNWRVKKKTQAKLGEYLAECRSATQKSGITQERKAAFEAMCQDYLHFASQCWPNECGNFVVDTSQGEKCDEGTTNKTASCPVNCGKLPKSRPAVKVSREMRTPEVCDDNKDNDGDGKVDCDDDDCKSSRSCRKKSSEPKEICDDNKDNDSDKLVDCSDSDCIRDSFCRSCANGHIGRQRQCCKSYASSVKLRMQAGGPETDTSNKAFIEEYNACVANPRGYAEGGRL